MFGDQQNGIDIEPPVARGLGHSLSQLDTVARQQGAAHVVGRVLVVVHADQLERQLMVKALAVIPEDEAARDVIGMRPHAIRC